MGPGPPPGAAIRSSTPKVRSSCQPVLSSGAKIGMAEFRTASAAKPAPVVDKKAIKHVKLNQTAVQSAARSGPPAEHAYVHAIELGLNWHFWTGAAALR